VPLKTWGSLRSASTLPSPVPFVKWVGGKGPLLAELRRHFPDFSEGQTYFEPFLGGGSVFFALRPHRAVLSDLNAPLIESYLAVRDHLDELTTKLASMPAPKEDADYYSRRTRYNQLLKGLPHLELRGRLELSALFIWLNHTCFNGLYRVNKDGLFNAALGDNPDPTIYSELNLRAVRRALRAAHVRLQCVDYESALASAGRGDIVYLDPPYNPSPNEPGFARYNSVGFDSAEQERLARIVHELVDRGCGVVLSNSHNRATVALYKDLRQKIVLAPRRINSDGSGRGKIPELLVIGRPA
jgi:DNA adenine methylase